MNTEGLTSHGILVVAAVAFGLIGCAVSLGYAFGVDQREKLRAPMVISGVLGAVAILGAWWTGDQLLAERPRLARFDRVADHVGYADALVLPTIAWLLLVLLTGLVNPRKGVLRWLLPTPLALVAAAVLALLALTGSPDARALWDAVRDQFG